MTNRIKWVLGPVLALIMSTSALAQRIEGPGLNGSQLLIFESDAEYSEFMGRPHTRNAVEERDKLETVTNPALENAHFSVVRDKFGRTFVVPVLGTLYLYNDVKPEAGDAVINGIVIQITDGPYQGRYAVIALTDEDSIERTKMPYLQSTLRARSEEKQTHDTAISKIHRATFANLKLGLNLKDTFDTLSSQGYKDLRERGEAYSYKTFRYGIKCPKGEDAAICQVYGNHDFLMEMEFAKKDIHGNTYRVIVDFTQFYMTGVQSALNHARINRINGFIGIKGPMTDRDYQALADEKYGANHNVVIGNTGEDWNHNRVCTCLYTGVGTETQNDTPHKVLTVTIEDEQLADDIDKAALDSDIEKRRKAAVKPQF
jgi:hypothetical protein